MKRLFITLVILLSVIAFSQAQEKLKIGEVKNGKLVIINQDALNTYFLNSLGKSGTLAKDFQVSTSPEGDRFFVYYPVSGNKDKVTNIGVMLVKIKNDVFIVEGQPKTDVVIPGGGGSYEVQCIGEDCTRCVPVIRWIGGDWLPYVDCTCTQTGGGICKMTTKIIIHIEF